MEKKLNGKSGSRLLIILESLSIIDLWLLVNIQWFMKQFIQLISPILKIFIFMIIGAVLLMAYALTQNRFGIVSLNKDLVCKNKNLLLVSKYLQIDYNSKCDTVTLKKELIEIKTKTMKLEKSLYKMNLHLKNLFDHQRNLDTNLADFASEMIGGLVIDTPGTLSYYNKKATQISVFGIPIWKPNYYTPRKVIQPWTQPGECWAFQGSHGKITIELAHSAIIDRVTLEHIPASASLTGNIDSAPQAFNLLGKLKNQYVMIDTFLYKKNGLPSQMFEITKTQMTRLPFKRIILEILSNWGNQDYTCIYRFKVHGKMVDISSEAVNIKTQ